MATDMSAERHILCELHSKPGHRDRMKDLLLDLVRVARTEQGNLSYNVFEDQDRENAFYIVDGWATKQAYLDHHNSAHVASVVDKMNPILDGEIVENVTIRFSAD